MSFGFRVCFALNGEGSLSSDKEFISFEAHEVAHPLKLSSGVAGVEIGKTDRFSISGGSFETAEAAQSVAEQVRVALLRRATINLRGIDLGQQSLKIWDKCVWQAVHRRAAEGPCRARRPSWRYSVPRRSETEIRSDEC
jgi:hypothetical protein